MVLTRSDDGSEQLNLRDQAYSAFTQGLLSRTLKPGQFISQRELADVTGFSLGAIRELIPRLEAEDLIRTIPQRGMQIAQVDMLLVRQAFQLRLFLEKEAIAVFTRSVSEAELTKIRKAHESVLERMEKSPSPRVIQQAQAVDWGFHDQLIASLGNALITNIYRINSIKIRLIRQSQTRLEGDLVAPVMRDHMKVIEAIEARDPEQAVAALSAHIEGARLRALDL
jgi:DNA-binding GntR family transcriptional regulator